MNQCAAKLHKDHILSGPAQVEYRSWEVDFVLKCNQQEIWRNTNLIYWAAKAWSQVQFQWILHGIAKLVGKNPIVLEPLEMERENLWCMVQLKLLLQRHLGLTAFTSEVDVRIINFLRPGERRKSIYDVVHIINLQAEIEQRFKCVWTVTTIATSQLKQWKYTI